MVMYIFRGLPGSGKTTKAKELRAKIGGVLVGRDHLRELLFGLEGYTITNASETRVTKLQEQMIRDALRRVENVFVDDMNLRNKYVTNLMKIAAETGALVEIVDLSNIPLETCLKQNKIRARQVSEEAIEGLHKRFVRGRGYPLPIYTTGVAEEAVPNKYIPDASLPPAIICDLDGTLALHTSGRSPYDMTRVYEDTLNMPIAEILWALDEQGFNIIFTSARNECARADTVKWLRDKVGFGPGRSGPFRLFLRADDDGRQDAIVKREIFDEHIRNNYNVLMVLDDRRQVIDMWRSLGLTCLDVAGHTF